MHKLEELLHSLNMKNQLVGSKAQYGMSHPDQVKPNRNHEKEKVQNGSCGMMRESKNQHEHNRNQNLPF